MARPPHFDELEVLDKAVRLFWEKGYCDTSAQDLSTRLSLNRSSIYNTFKDKHTLFVRALQHYRRSESAGLLAFLEQQEPGLPALRNLLSFVTHASLSAVSCKGCLMVNSAAELGTKDAAVRGIIEENVREVVLAFEVFIRRGQASGAFPADKDAEGLAVALFHSITALRVTTKVISDPVFFEKNIEATLLIFQ